MQKNLIVVESPAKAKTIKKYLGNSFEVLASYGHVRDLRPKTGAVETDNDFFMHYVDVSKNAKHIKNLISAIKKADALYLATDPDREGEAIAWHIVNIFQEHKLLKNKPIYRVAFYEITKDAINQAVNNPRSIAMNLVNAQQARRALDYLVGFNLSPLLWSKIRRGLSAGRVQSPALRMIIERETEIENFITQEYWDIIAQLTTDNTIFPAKLVEYMGEKKTQFSITTEQQATDIKNHIMQEAEGKITVGDVTKKQRKRYPPPPFTTSTMQQDAARKLGLSAERTMRIAQQLYEGIDIGQGTIGLITYMRTDSVNLAQIALNEIRETITDIYDKSYLPPEPVIYHTKAKNAQEAHEAIRPTSMMHKPENLKKFLSAEQYKLYKLIWQRTIACQMIWATIDTVSVNLKVVKQQHTIAVFRATGSVIKHPGFMQVYHSDKKDLAEVDTEKFLPPLHEDQLLPLHILECNQHFTEPPPRYSEANLIKALEECGIGRPSTYAAIISTLQRRDYAKLENKRFHPSDIGKIVNRFLTQYFPNYLDYNFTANLEDQLDAVARGEKFWIPLLQEFWQPFKNNVVEITKTVKREDVTQEILQENCPLCSLPLSIRLGKNNRFIGCSGYPNCSYTRDINSNEKNASNTMTEEKCPDCGHSLQIKHSRYGKFIGCSNYPTCKHVRSIQQNKDTGIVCPECHKNKMLERKSKRGKVFFSCKSYPECKYATWNQPVPGPCPKCAWPILTSKTTKKKGTEHVCPRTTCKFSKIVDSDPS